MLEMSPSYPFSRAARAMVEKILRGGRKSTFPTGDRTNFFPRGRIEKLSAWVAPNPGVLCGLAEVSRAVLNSVPVFLMFKVRWDLDQVSLYL